MDSSPVHERRLVWAFWIACGLAAVGGIAPFVLGGGSNRISGVVFPFAVGAIALGACAMLYRQGRPVTTGLYFLAGLAIVFGILALVTVPLRLAVIGTCPPEPARCALGLERPLTVAEDTALAFAIGMGIVAILTGFFALVMLYRRQSVIPSTPPVRRIDPVATRPPAETAPPAPAQAVVSKPETPAEPDPVVAESAPELPPPAEELELPAPHEALELPAPAEAAATPEDAPPVAPAPRNPRRRRASKAPPESPPAPNIDA